MEGGKPANPEKNTRTNNKLDPWTYPHWRETVFNRSQKLRNNSFLLYEEGFLIGKLKKHCMFCHDVFRLFSSKFNNLFSRVVHFFQSLLRTLESLFAFFVLFHVRHLKM